MSENVPNSNGHFTDDLNINQTDSMFLELIDECQIIQIINKLKPQMSLGHDKFTIK